MAGMAYGPGYVDEATTGTRWRVGRHVGRTIYVQPGDAPDRARDVLIGMMDTPELAQLVVDAVNNQLVRDESTA